VRDGGLKRSLGVVSGPGQAELELPADATLPGSLVQLLVEPIGGGQSYLSQALVINPGERVELIVHNNLSLSTESLARW
jgi:anti-sigma-K factor RskA